MIDAICRELELQKKYLGTNTIETIYLGGGTPSILSASELEQLFNTVYKHYRIEATPEITMEANPDDLSESKLKDVYRLGVNRLSIGIQTFHDELLTFLNRAHTADEAKETYRVARQIGFDNISVDLIFSIPGQSKSMLASDLEEAIDLNPEHISIYSLTIEEKTVFGNWHKRGKFIALSDEASAEQFGLIMSELEKAGFDQYEISNFCRDGYYSRHNTNYWKDIWYLGLGPGAHSYNGISRQHNVAQNHAYMKSLEENKIPFEIEYLDLTEKSNEYLLTSMRTKWGCNLSKLKSEFNYDLLAIQKDELQRLEDLGLIRLEGEVLLLTKEGKFVADTVIGDLFQD